MKGAVKRNPARPWWLPDFFRRPPGTRTRVTVVEVTVTSDMS